MANTFSESLNRIDREPISAYIMRVVTQYLLSGELKPGDRLPTETEFASKLGVGRNSVREAIKMLSSIGVVNVKRGCGMYIADSISSSMINPLILSLVFEQGTSLELFQMRLLLDTAAAEFALPKITQPDIASLERKNTELLREAGKKKPDYHRLRDLDLGFHQVIYRLSGNRFLERIGSAIYALFMASIEKNTREDPVGSYHVHQLIIDAIKKKDIGSVRRVLHDSTVSWLKTLQAEETQSGFLI